MSAPVNHGTYGVLLDTSGGRQVVTGGRCACGLQFPEVPLDASTGEAHEVVAELHASHLLAVGIHPVEQPEEDAEVVISVGANRRLTTPEELNGLPVGAKVWAPTGREYTVEIWNGHPGHEDNTTTRVLTAPGRVSGASSFIALHGWASLDPVSVPASVEDVVAGVLLAHPGYRLTLDNDGFTARCGSTACEWAVHVEVGTPGFRPEREHAKHVAHQVATAAGLTGAGE